MDKKEQAIVKETIATLLQYLQIDGDFSFTQEEDVIDVLLETNDTGMVIGYHGEILESLQLVFSLCLSKKLGKFYRVTIEVGDYRKNRTEWLHQMAAQTKARVLAEEREISLPSLKSWERRIVHMALQDDPEVVSESVGEGRDRTLVIKQRT